VESSNTQGVQYCRASNKNVKKRLRQYNWVVYVYSRRLTQLDKQQCGCHFGLNKIQANILWSTPLAVDNSFITRPLEHVESSNTQGVQYCRASNKNVKKRLRQYNWVVYVYSRRLTCLLLLLLLLQKHLMWYICCVSCITQVFHIIIIVIDMLLRSWWWLIILFVFILFVFSTVFMFCLHYDLKQIMWILTDI